jgi:hypothetical protein
LYFIVLLFVLLNHLHFSPFYLFLRIAATLKSVGREVHLLQTINEESMVSLYLSGSSAITSFLGIGARSQRSAGGIAAWRGTRPPSNNVSCCG